MTWTLIITSPADRAMRDIPRADVEHINSAFEALRSDPYDGDIQFLRGTDRTLRRRVGSWRILFKVHPKDRLVIILDVIRRSSTTY